MTCKDSFSVQEALHLASRTLFIFWVIALESGTVVFLSLLSLSLVRIDMKRGEIAPSAADGEVFGLPPKELFFPGAAVRHFRARFDHAT